MKAFKGFNSKLQCTPVGTPFQYELGSTYEEPKAALCSKGFHACENPLDVIRYYDPSVGSRYCEVELDGVTDETKDDSKRVGKKITIGAEIHLKGLIEAGVKFIFEKTEASPDTAATTGECANAATTGECANAATTGYGANAATTGERSISASVGYEGTARGAIGNWLVLAEWKFNDQDKLYPADVKAVRVDGEIIKANTDYKLVDGQFIEA